MEQPPSLVVDLVAEISTAAAILDTTLHPKTAANLAALIRVMNTYYSNLIEGHHTQPRDIERALRGKLDKGGASRDLQLEAAAHVRVQAQLDELAGAAALPEPASREFLRGLHREFYRGASLPMLIIKSETRSLQMVPGEWRSRRDHDVAVGQHLPPSSPRVEAFMVAFEQRYRFAGSIRTRDRFFPVVPGMAGGSSLLSRGVMPMAVVSLLIAVIAAILNTVQSGANSQLNKSLQSPLATALTVYLVGGAGVVLAIAVSSLVSTPAWPSKGMIAATPWWAWVGGLLGLTYVFAMLLFANKLGAAVFGAVTLGVAMVTSVLLDQFGLVGFKVHPANAWRIIGCILMIGGAALIAKF